MSPELKARILKTRYQPTTVGNMMIDPEGGYCSFEAVEILRSEIEALKQQVEQGKRDAVPEWISCSSEIKPRYGEHVAVLTTNCDDDPVAIMANYNGKNLFLSIGGKKVTPALCWYRLPAAPKQEN